MLDIQVLFTGIMIFRTPSQLLNTANKGSILTDFGCSTGKFGEPDVDCFAEQFLLYPTGQPIAYISNSSLGFTSTEALPPIFLFIDNLG
ncbi:MAG: hypothetical protein IPN18_19945 [Ignavibacteriales bacterium]|nr:hypothetical protein [Ignavibacteriales bacterium]